ncbi:MAG: S41 family peptidase [Xanthomonadales bacterium]|nr:S41 family peptidase [Xanthomonadales bacterium]
MSKRFTVAVVLSLLGSVAVAQVDDESIPQRTQLTLDDLRTFTEVFARVQRDYVEETHDRELLENAIRGMLSDLDPHTSFLNKEQYAALEEDTTGQYGGIGIEVLWIEGQLSVARVMPGTPAEKNDVRQGDRVLAVDGTPIADLPQPTALGNVRGRPGTEVVLTIQTEGEEPRDVTLVREVIAVASVDARLLDDRYAVITIRSFQEDTAEEVSSELERLKAQAGRDLDGMVLDLRGNPGGVLGSAVGVSDLFLEEGLIVYTKGRSTEAQLSFSAGPQDELSGAPIIVLVDDTTASASEIVAGALQDHGRAVVLGTQTFGKGSVQSVVPLYNGGAIKLTTARYYTPNGRSIQAAGIQPDIDISGDSFAAVGDQGTREIDLDGHLPGDAEPSQAADMHGLAGEDYALYRALSLLRGHTILGRLDRSRTED